MIETLRIENLAIVEEAELAFGPGLNVITGETGAGKSIVLGALSLLAGGRANSDSVRDGSDSARVEAVFRTEQLADLERALGERGLEPEGHELIVQRNLARSGRGRARVSGQLVPQAVLGELFDGRIEISSQHDSQGLRRPEVHGWLLDRAGGLLEARERVAAGHRRVRALDAELAELQALARDRERQIDFLRFQLREIDEAELDPETDAALAVERSRLAHATRIRDEGAEALAALAGDPTGTDISGAADLAATAARRVAALAQLDAELAPMAPQLVGLADQLRDVARDLERHLDGVEDDPARLGAVDERLARIEALGRKYGGSVAEVLRFRDAAAAELDQLDQADARSEALAMERTTAVEALARDAATLGEGRRKAATRLSRGVAKELRQLGMPQARFETALVPVTPPAGLPCGPAGAEAAEFRFSANAGEALRPFQRVASGGELSRALLALRGALRDEARGMVLVFDEVDAGVGGRAADRVGAALARLAAHHQVLCITHLPQIAAFAQVHLRVDKSTRKGRTTARVAPVTGDDRIEELARMAGGERVGEATRRHARELLAARTGK